MASYEFWLTDDGGKRIGLINDFFYVSYSRTVVGFGSFEIGMSYDTYRKTVFPFFTPDRRMEVWRSPAYGIPLRLERIYILREVMVYTRADGVEVVRLFGRDGIDLLNRRYVIQAEGTSYVKKTSPVDDMMKEIVREQMLYGSCRDAAGALSNTRAYPTGEFLVDINLSLGTSTSKTFQNKNVLDVLKELKDISITQGNPIYFDVIETQVGNAWGWTFRTYKGLRGVDRTSALEFSVENENLTEPEYMFNYLESVNDVYIRNNTTYTEVSDTDQIQESRWNRVEVIRYGYYETDLAGLTAIGQEELNKSIPQETIKAVFLNVPETQRSPRSLYGIDWDLGDLVRVNYAGKQASAEILIVYVSIDETGSEKITGRNRVGQ